MKGIFIVAFALISFTASAQDTARVEKPKLYHPEANAQKDIQAAVKQAKKENKFVLLQSGGNWCSWCKLFNKTITQDKQLDSMLNANFISYHLNYSDENKNEAVFAKYGFPQRFGFPVFIILDEKGNRIHTQNSAYLEEGKGYNKKKVMEFFEAWSPAALDPAQNK